VGKKIFGGRKRTPRYAASTFSIVTFPFHMFALLKTKTMDKQPMNPIQATTGWKWVRREENWDGSFVRTARL